MPPVFLCYRSILHKIKKPERFQAYDKDQHRTPETCRYAVLPPIISVIWKLIQVLLHHRRGHALMGGFFRNEAKRIP